MTEIVHVFTVLTVAIVAGYSVWSVSKAAERAADEQRRLFHDWWQRSQAHIDNLQDRVMAKEWEVYAQATTVQRPSDQPMFTADGEAPSQMAADLLATLQNRYADESYDDLVGGVADDYITG